MLYIQYLGTKVPMWINSVEKCDNASSLYYLHLFYILKNWKHSYPPLFSMTTGFKKVIFSYLLHLDYFFALSLTICSRFSTFLIIMQKWQRKICQTKKTQNSIQNDAMRCDATSRPKHFKLVQYRFAYQYEKMYKLLCTWLGHTCCPLEQNPLPKPKPKPELNSKQSKLTRETVARRANKRKKLKKRRNATLDTKSQTKKKKKWRKN